MGPGGPSWAERIQVGKKIRRHGAEHDLRWGARRLFWGRDEEEDEKTLIILEREGPTLRPRQLSSPHCSCFLVGALELATCTLPLSGMTAYPFLFLAPKTCPLLGWHPWRISAGPGRFCPKAARSTRNLTKLLTGSRIIQKPQNKSGLLSYSSQFPCLPCSKFFPMRSQVTAHSMQFCVGLGVYSIKKKNPRTSRCSMSWPILGTNRSSDPLL